MFLELDWVMILWFRVGFQLNVGNIVTMSWMVGVYVFFCISGFVFS